MLLKSGDNKGKPCGKKINKNSTTGRFCSMHYKKAEQENTKTVTVKREEEIEGLVIKKDRYGHFVYGNTGLVFKNNKDKYIYAKTNEDGVLSNISEDDILVCKKYSLKFKRNGLPIEPKTKPKSTLDHTKNMSLYE
jgi:hypothetical protein